MHYTKHGPHIFKLAPISVIQIPDAKRYPYLLRQLQLVQVNRKRIKIDRCSLLWIQSYLYHIEHLKKVFL